LYSGELNITAIIGRWPIQVADLNARVGQVPNAEKIQATSEAGPGEPEVLGK